MLYIVVSLDGYIVDENGSVEWLEFIDSEGDVGYEVFFDNVDIVVMGWMMY